MTKKKCRQCGAEMHRDDQGQWFCPDCVVQHVDAAFLDEDRDERGDLEAAIRTRLTKQQVSTRLSATDVDLAKRLAKRKGASTYQSYIKALLQEALVREGAD